MHSNWLGVPNKSLSLSGIQSQLQKRKLEQILSKCLSSSKFLFVIDTELIQHLGDKINPEIGVSSDLNKAYDQQFWYLVSIKYIDLWDIVPKILILCFWSGYQVVVYFTNFWDDSDMLWNLGTTRLLSQQLWEGMTTRYRKRLKRKAMFTENLLYANIDYMLSHLIFLAVFGSGRKDIFP